MSRFAPAPPRRLLVRGVNWLGDAVMSTPALLRLREALPDTHITLLSPGKLADLWNPHPALDALLTLDPGESPWAVARRLRPLDFDAALILPNSPRSALECWAARIPRRIGYARPWRNLFLTEPVPTRPGTVRMRKPSGAEIRARLQDPSRPTAPPPPPGAHHCHEYLHLAARLGADPAPISPRLALAPAEIEHARAKFGLGPETTWLALNPGAEYGPAKRWPAERFGAVARSVQDAGHGRWILLGGRNDQPVTAAIRARLDSALDLAGRTTLRELMAVLAATRLLLTNDTGPMHVAAALGLPVVVPFGSTSPELTGPGLPGDPLHRWIRAGAPCAPCFLRECPIDFRCMLDIRIETVTAAVREILGTIPPRQP
jgi:heptosyltransferase-2